MSKKGINILSDEKIKGNLFDEDNEEDTNELKKIQSLLSQSKENIEENDDNNNDLNNKTNVSDRDNIYENEIKDANKSKENNNDENELSETYLTNKNSCEGEENSQLKSDDNIEINKLNKNNNINLFKNEFESNINNKNINNQKLIINKNIFDNEEYLLSEIEESGKEIKKSEQKKKFPIFSIRKIKKRSKKIQFLRKKKGIHLKRKKDSDIIRKKIKTYFHNYLIDKLNIEIKIINWKKTTFDMESNLSPKKVKRKKINKFLKFNNKFTTNVSINLNRNLLLKKIYQILIEIPISSKYKTFHPKNNSYLTKYLLSLKSITSIHKIFNSTYEDSFKEFLKSPHFQKILEHIKKKDGMFYLNKFKKVCLEFTSFYNKGKQKNSPKKEKTKTKFILTNNLNINKEESKRSKKSKKSKRSISFCLHNKTPNSIDDNKFRSSLYFHSINSKNNIISLFEDYSMNLFSKEESEHILFEKSDLLKDVYEISNINSFMKENEEISDELKYYKISDEMNNLSIIKKSENEKGENEFFNELNKMNINT